MREDLLFHLTTEELFNQSKQNTKYIPQSLDEEGFIHCSTGSQVEATANRHFSGEEQVLLLVKLVP